MDSRVMDDWNAGADKWYARKVTADTLARIQREPAWVFPKPVWAMLEDALPDIAGKRVLVPSCGDCCAAFALSVLGARVTACDLAQRQLDNGAAVAAAQGWSIDFKWADSMDLKSIDEDQYDLVYTSNGVHVWIPEPQRMYRSFHRVLRPGGRYIGFEVHPFSRPFSSAAAAALGFEVEKPYTETGPFGAVPNYHWRLMDLVNAMLAGGFSLSRLEEFTSDTEVYDNWWYENPLEAQKDGNRLGDWRQNPWAALPQWIGFSAKKA